MEDDYDSLLHQDFTNDQVLESDHEKAASFLQEVKDAEASDAAQEQLLPDDQPEDEHPKPRGSGRRGRRKKSENDDFASEEEKKVKQRAQNRIAAEKSRSKKRGELDVLEQSVKDVEEENIRLRARLAALSGHSGGSEPTPDTAVPKSVETASAPIEDPLAIDHGYLKRLQAELEAARETLLNKQIEVARLLGAEFSDEVEAMRSSIFSQHGNLVTLQAETSSLDRMMGHLMKEREDINKQADLIRADIDERKNGTKGQVNGKAHDANPQDSSAADGGDKQAGSSRVEQALMEIRGWVDAAVREWGQSPAGLAASTAVEDTSGQPSGT